MEVGSAWSTSTITPAGMLPQPTTPDHLYVRWAHGSSMDPEVHPEPGVKSNLPEGQEWQFSCDKQTVRDPPAFGL